MPDISAAEARSWIERHLAPQSWSGYEAAIRCPLPEHDDRHASAGANADKRTWFCHGCNAGGLLSELAEQLGVPETWYSVAASAIHSNGAARQQSARTVYRYCDRHGAPLLEVVRYRDKSNRRRTAMRHRPEWHPGKDPKKQPKPDGWAWCMPDIGGGLLYRAEEIHEPNGPVIVVEGEKDANRLATLGFHATCNLGGAGKWSDFHTERMPTGRDVVVIGDTDKPGQAHAATVALALEQGYRGQGRAASVRMVSPAQLGYAVTPDHGKDVSDWLDEDPARDRTSIERLIAGAEPLDAPVAELLVGDADAGGQRAAPAGKADARACADLMAAKLSDQAAYSAGRGWFWRPTPESLWRRDDEALAVRAATKELIDPEAARGTRTRVVLSEAEPLMAVPGDQWDADDAIVGLPSGKLLNIRTAEQRTCSRDDRVTFRLGVDPKPGRPDEWIMVQVDAFAPAHENTDAVIDYLRWWFKQALTGDCSSEALVFLYGPPGSGKSTIADTMSYVAGEYAASVSAEHVVGETSAHRAWLARLDRKRLIRIGELPPRGAWKTADLLALVSGEVLSANHMRAETFDFRSRAHVLVTGNHAPQCPSGSGFWRRLRQVSCRHVPSNPDPNLKQRLREEAPRILHWTLGAPDEEPPVPEEMTMAAASMRLEADPLGEWMNDCVESVGYELGDSTDDLYQGYKAWCRDLGDPISYVAFRKRITETLGESRNRTRGGRAVKVRAVRLKASL